ncbi:MAG: hypothetical protein ACE5HX_06485 [bacterium]
MILLCLLIIFAFAVNALMDGIAFTKSPQGRDLKYLWHLAKYVWVGLVLSTGIVLHRQYLVTSLLNLLLAAGISFILGAIIWSVTYKIYRKIDWPDWA